MYGRHKTVCIRNETFWDLFFAIWILSNPFENFHNPYWVLDKEIIRKLATILEKVKKLAK